LAVVAALALGACNRSGNTDNRSGTLDASRTAEVSPPPAVTASPGIPTADAGEMPAPPSAPSATSNGVLQEEDGAKVPEAEDPEAEAPEAAEEDDLFAECQGLWRRWKPEPRRIPPKPQPGVLRIVPDTGCPTPSGWAGHWFWSREHVFGFSADSRFFENGCKLHPVGGGNAGSLCTEDEHSDQRLDDPGVAVRARRLGIGAPEGRWPRDDLYLRWSIEQGGGVVYDLCSSVTSKCAKVYSFAGAFAIPLDVEVSPDATWLAIVSTHVADSAEVEFLKVAKLVALLPAP
jgi:hypothetical protein